VWFTPFSTPSLPTLWRRRKGEFPLWWPRRLCRVLRGFCLGLGLAFALPRRFQTREEIVQRSFFGKLDDEFLVGIWERIAHRGV
jgi:hypothetical protein